MTTRRRATAVRGSSRRCRRPSSTSTSTARSGSTPRSSWRGPAASTRRATGPGCRERSSRRCRAVDQAELLEAFDLPIALMQDAEALERITARARRDEGRRERPLRRDPLGSAAPRRAAGCRSRTGSPRSAPAPADAARADRARSSGSSAPRCARTTRPRTSSLAETAVRFRDQGLTGWDLAGPEEAFPDPRPARRARSRPPAPAACGSRSTPASGAAPAQVRRALAMDPERIAHGPGTIDDPALCAELDRARRDAGPVPDLELAGRDRAVASRPIRSPGSTATACRSRSRRTTRRSPTSRCPRSTPNAVERDRADARRSCGRSTGTPSTSRSPTRRRSRRSAAAFDAWARGIPELRG